MILYFMQNITWSKRAGKSWWTNRHAACGGITSCASLL